MSEMRTFPREPVTPAQAKAIKAYAKLMGEVRFRANGIIDLLSDGADLPQQVKIEAAFLQLRLICELIALSCLVAHGDLKEVNAARLQKAYEADFIIKVMQRLHSNFFPVPHDLEFKKNLLSQISGYQIVPVELNFLTKEALIQLYRRTGSILHRGSLKALAKSKPNEEDLINEIVSAHAQIVGLLASHHIITRERDFVIVCEIPEEGEVNVVFAGHVHYSGCDCPNLIVV